MRARRSCLARGTRVGAAAKAVPSDVLAFDGGGEPERRASYYHAGHVARRATAGRPPVRPGQDAEDQPLRDGALVLRRLLPRAWPVPEAAPSRRLGQGLRG